MSDVISSSLQESVLTLLATNNKKGKIASGLITPEQFDDDYRDIATRILAYHKSHGKAPGRAHLDDLFDDILGNKKHKRRQRVLRVIEGILHQEEGLNSDYVLSRVSEFSRLQSLKRAWFDSADIIEAGKDGAVEEVERLWHSALKQRKNTLQTGVFLNDKSRALEFLDHVDDFYPLGIRQLDRVAFAPTPGELLLLVAPKGRGKSWFAVHCGRKCLQQGAKVVHCTLEMPAWQVTQRYYQNFFAIPKRGDKYEITEFEFDELKRLTGFKTNVVKPTISLSDKNIRKFLKGKIDDWGVKFKNLMVAEFASGSLTVEALEAFLDSVELVHGFIPNVLILDSPDLMRIDKNHIRESTGRTYVDLRGLLQRRHLAGVATTQGNRSSWDAVTVKGSMVAEDASKLMTAGMAAILSQTPAEKERGLARLFIEKHRNDEDGFTVLISQNYKAGQFVLGSARMSSRYWKLVKGEEA